MGLPIYYIQMYEKVPPIVNYTDLTQEIPKLVLATGKEEKSEKKKSAKSKKSIKILMQPLKY